MKFKKFLNENSNAFSFIPTLVDFEKNFEYKEQIKEIFDFIQNKTNNFMVDPISISLNKNAIKIHRSISSIININILLTELKNKFKNWKFSEGNGSRKGLGIKNKGTSFEKDIINDLNEFKKYGLEDAKFKFPNIIKKLYPYLKNFGNFEIIHEGTLNQRRPIQFDGNNLKLGSGSINIGKIVSDITLKNGNKFIYLSLKFGKTYRIANLGLKNFINDKIYENINDKKSQEFIESFGINYKKYKNSFINILNNIPNNVEEEDITWNKEFYLNFLKQAIGCGYILVNINNIEEITEEILNNSINIKSIILKYPNKNSKTLYIYVYTNDEKYTFMFRNNSGKIIPNVIQILK